MQESDVVDWYEHETLSLSGSTVVPFTAANAGPVGATRAKCTVETASIRYWEDGDDPSSTEGILVASGGSFVVFGRSAVTKFRAIAVSGSPKIQVLFGR